MIKILVTLLILLTTISRSYALDHTRLIKYLGQHYIAGTALIIVSVVLMALLAKYHKGLFILFVIIACIYLYFYAIHPA